MMAHLSDWDIPSWVRCYGALVRGIQRGMLLAQDRLSPTLL